MIVAESGACLWPLAGRPIVEHVIERARPQVSALTIVARSDPWRYGGIGLPVLEPDSHGLLSAVLAGLKWAAANVREAPWLAAFAADVPFFPSDLVSRLGQAVGDEGADMALPQTSDRSLPAFGIWPVRLRGALKRALAENRALSVDEWAARYRVARIDFAADANLCRSINSTDDLTDL
jgi:molybdopterin-guanine dinucleotide biosynthesis protein A